MFPQSLVGLLTSVPCLFNVTVSPSVKLACVSLGAADLQPWQDDVGSTNQARADVYWGPVFDKPPHAAHTGKISTLVKEYTRGSLNQMLSMQTVR